MKLENAYEIEVRAYGGIKATVCATTAGKAKYDHYLMLDETFDSFGEYLHYVESCKLLHKARKEDYFRKFHDFERTANYRGVPLATYGTEVELDGRRGFIVGANDSCNFDVAFDNGVFNCHPNYELVYYGEHGNVLYDFRKLNKEA